MNLKNVLQACDDAIALKKYEAERAHEKVRELLEDNEKLTLRVEELEKFLEKLQEEMQK